jgi:hypothetical protein
LVGIALLRQSWLKRQQAGPAMALFGWLAIIAGLAAFDYGLGGKLGTAYGLLALAAIGYCAVAATIQFRRGKPRQARDIAMEPEERPTNWPRAIAKSLLAIVLAGTASIGLGVAFAVAMPMNPPDRIVIGGLLVPLLWGGGMAWTLCDAKLVRATLLLLAVSAVGYGIAFLPKVLS